MLGLCTVHFECIVILLQFLDPQSGRQVSGRQVLLKELGGGGGGTCILSSHYAGYVIIKRNALVREY